MTTLRELTDRIHATNEKLGWLANENTWGELLFLLQSEISEIGQTYRVRRLARYVTATGKPDDVASELADCVIRFLSMYHIQGIEPWNMDTHLAEVPPVDIDNVEPFEDTFGDWVCWLTRESCRIWMNPSWSAGRLLRAFVAFAQRWQIDLTAEVERKMAYNATRPFQHGGTISDRPVTA